MSNPIHTSNERLDQLQISRMSLDRIRQANYYLKDYIGEALVRHPDLAAIFLVTKSEIDKLSADEAALRSLMGTPYLVVSPTLTDVADWKSLASGGTSTVAVDRLRREAPRLSDLDKLSLFYNNRLYLWLVVEVLHASVIAAPLLGISLELATYLRSVPQHTLDLMIGKLEFPIFRWRLASKLFWIDLGSGNRSEEAFGHFFLASTPNKANRIDHKAPWADLVLPRYRTKIYSEIMIQQKCRASTVSSLLGIRPPATRELYKEFHGESSPCGQMPKSLNWYFESPSHRLQGTMLITLYRIGLANDCNVPEAFIAAFDAVTKFFGSDLKLTPDRACHLARSMGTDAHLSLSPCRSCGTPYLISVAGTRPQLSGSFSCSSCSGALGTSQSIKKRRKR
jgi:hypothetical protein